MVPGRATGRGCYLGPGGHKFAKWQRTRPAGFGIQVGRAESNRRDDFSYAVRQGSGDALPAGVLGVAWRGVALCGGALAANELIMSQAHSFCSRFI